MFSYKLTGGKYCKRNTPKPPILHSPHFQWVVKPSLSPPYPCHTHTPNDQEVNSLLQITCLASGHHGDSWANKLAKIIVIRPEHVFPLARNDLHHRREDIQKIDFILNFSQGHQT